MTDDERLVALFREAAADAPPPGFGYRDVVGASRRITARRRALAGSMLGLLVVFAGVGVSGLVAGGFGSPGDEVRTAAPLAAPEMANEGGGSAAARRTGVDAAAPVPASPPLGPGQRECADRQDPALRAYVEQVLPEVVGAPEAATTAQCRPGGERGVNLEVVDDGGRRGVLTVSYLPPGAAPPPASPGRTVAIGTAPTASGGTVLVHTRSTDGGPPPFAGRVDAVVAFLAPRL